MDIKLPAMIVINGVCGSGKTTCIRYIMKQNKSKFDYGIVFSHTAFDGGFEYIPKKFIHTTYNPEKLTNLMLLQKKAVEQYKKGQIKKMPESFVIFDDMLDKACFSSELIKQLATQFRHFHITPIISTQYSKFISPALRDNCSDIIIFKCNGEASFKSLHESYGQAMKYNEWKDFIIKNTKDHSFIYYNTVIQEYLILKCPKIKPFKLKY